MRAHEEDVARVLRTVDIAPGGGVYTRRVRRYAVAAYAKDGKHLFGANNIRAISPEDAIQSAVARLRAMVQPSEGYSRREDGSIRSAAVTALTDVHEWRVRRER